MGSCANRCKYLRHLDVSRCPVTPAVVDAIENQCKELECVVSALVATAIDCVLDTSVFEAVHFWKNDSTESVCVSELVAKYRLRFADHNPRILFTRVSRRYVSNIRSLYNEAHLIRILDMRNCGLTNAEAAVICKLRIKYFV